MKADAGSAFRLLRFRPHRSSGPRRKASSAHSFAGAKNRLYGRAGALSTVRWLGDEGLRSALASPRCGDEDVAFVFGGCRRLDPHRARTERVVTAVGDLRCGR